MNDETGRPEPAASPDARVGEPTGYEQVRSIVAALAGDREAADAVQLDLPETGVCSTGLVTEDLLPGATGQSAGQDGGCGTSCATEATPAPAAQSEPAGGWCCGPTAPEPVSIGIGAPAGLGFATGRVHGHSGDSPRSPATTRRTTSAP
ncbi:hypothetical protein [Actinomadura coerulea]|uniref:hypothetical protein n=1 Tax=Actinomadura coerulea TaxID=46159 RepID=UPI003F4E25AA